MKNFTNEQINKRYHNMKKMCLIGLCLLIVGNLGFGWFAIKSSKPMHDIVVGNREENKQAYIQAKSITDYFGYYEGQSNKFYFVMDEDNYIYVARMSPSKYTKIKNELSKGSYKIEGITIKTKTDMKEIAVEVYNELVEEENQITLNDFDDYFGSVYLDLNANTVESIIIILISFLLSIVGMVFTIMSVITIIRFHSNIKKLEPEQLEKIDRELNDENTKYYKNANIFLTENYVVNVVSSFNAIPYQDIIWMYQFIQRRNGVKVSQSIQLMTKKGKRYTVAAVNGFTKKAKNSYEQIQEVLTQKCPNALIGYTSENKKEAKKRIEK